jgi:hypothetical protein
MNQHGDRPSSRRDWRIMLAVLVLFITLVPAIFAIPAEQILFNPEIYKAALAEQGASAHFPQVMRDLAAVGGNRLLLGIGDRLLETLDRTGYQAVAEQIFPETWVQIQAEGLIDQFWAYFNFQSPELRLLVDLRPVRERLNGEAAAGIAATIVSGLPGCTTEEVLTFVQQALSGTFGRLPLCRPPEAMVELVNLVVADLLRGSAQAIPDQIDLSGGLRLAGIGGENTAGAWARWFSMYRLARQIFIWLPWLALICLLVVAVIGRRTSQGSYYWMGMGLGLCGITALLVTFLLALWSTTYVPMMLNRLLGERLVLYNTLVALSQAVVGQYLTAAGFSALAILLIGAACLGVWYWQKRKMGLSHSSYKTAPFEN